MRSWILGLALFLLVSTALTSDLLKKPQLRICTKACFEPSVSRVDRSACINNCYISSKTNVEDSKLALVQIIDWKKLSDTMSTILPNILSAEYPPERRENELELEREISKTILSVYWQALKTSLTKVSITDKYTISKEVLVVSSEILPGIIYSEEDDDIADETAYWNSIVSKCVELAPQVISCESQPTEQEINLMAQLLIDAATCSIIVPRPTQKLL